MPTYPKAPIVEAVLELRYLAPVAPELLERARKRIEDDYPLTDPVRNVRVEFQANPMNPKITEDWSGFRCTSLDRSDLVIFRTDALVCSRLTPYLGWEYFRDHAVSAWASLQRVAGKMPLERIGLRYINRIDVPNERIPFNPADYVSVALSIPPTIAESMNTYALQMTSDISEDQLKLIVNSGSVPSPLVGFSSILLDIDLVREVDIPRRDDDLWILIERMRVQKNLVFEGCITDLARKLFSQ